jgi:hypothetical protein
MESGIDSRHFNFVHQVGRAGEGVCRIRNRAVHGNCEVRSAELSGKNCRNRARHATVRGGVLRVAWGLC